LCGIIGYNGTRPAAPLLLKGLAKLEYRGYDSAGIALLDGDGLWQCKRQGRLQMLAQAVAGGTDYPQQVGIGHTRWATHGKPSDENAHPHRSERFTVVHNGIIENYLALKGELLAQGVTFRSETDTEVVTHLLEQNYRGDVLAALRDTVARLEGSYALGILCAERPGELFAVRQQSPLIIGLAEDGYFLASDVTAVLAHTRWVILPEDGDMACLTADGVRVWDHTGQPVERPVQQVDWDVAAAEKGGYDHFMLKEIYEQPSALQDTLSPRIGEDGTVRLDDIVFSPQQLEALRRIVIVACGSAYHAGVVGKYYLEQLLGLPVEVDVASEFRYRNPLVDDRTLTIIISQSGETADTLAALREAKRRGSPVLAIVNVVGSTIARESDHVLYTHAGPEIAVATTKGYTTQVSLLHLIGLSLAQQMGRLTPPQAAALLADLRRLPALARQVAEDPKRVQQLAAVCAGVEHTYFIGRHIDYAVAMEASLKLKEISYIHAEAYAAGELKHGTISLVEEGTLVVALACQPALLEKTLSNIREVKSRGARVLVVTTESQAALFAEADALLTIPEVPPLLAAIPEIIPLQLLAYYVALARGCDIDKPRNLAKSVTVE